ncbi:MAG: sugar ABC transporter ATP-binding protein [Synergistaceae bacterium]|jgi:ribose transport system ATP-binding protein|nr:sugar ABC transporter ATP-binding protein [Synergistaceae bacterium]
MGKNILFTARNITKKYPGTMALKDVSAELFSGEVVGLVGENGAGKSTLLKIIMGNEQPTEGVMTMHGIPFAPKTPIEANNMGVGMVFQEQSLIQNLTVGQNIFFGMEDKYTRFCVLNKRKMHEDASRILEDMRLNHIRADRKVSSLEFATRQMVEICKVFHVVKRSGLDSCLILLDEPTSVLSDGEVRNLFENIRLITAEGHTVIFVSHRLDEVLEISDRIIVFKDGEKVDEVLTAEADESILYEKMVGRTASGEYYKVSDQVEPGGEVLLETRDLGRRGYFRNVNLTLHAGEILGICGVVGSGKEDLCAVLCGDESPTSGQLLVRGEGKKFGAPQAALKNGILSIPKERREESIIASASVSENIAMSNFGNISKIGLISKKLEKAQAENYRGKMHIRASSLDQKVGFLSGGNAQKVVFARALASDADILILNHPTRGVDVGAKEEIYSLIRSLAVQGKGCVLLGDTLDECIGLSNRLLVMKDGEVTRECDASPGNKPEQVDIVKYMM